MDPAAVAAPTVAAARVAIAPAMSPTPAPPIAEENDGDGGWIRHAARYPREDAPRRGDVDPPRDRLLVTLGRVRANASHSARALMARARGGTRGSQGRVEGVTDAAATWTVPRLAGRPL